MIGSLLRVVLIAQAGGRGSHPFRSALIKVGFACGGALALGIALGRAVWSTAFPGDLPKVWIALLLASGGYAITGLLLLSIDASSARGSRQAKLGELVSVWPLSRGHQWLARSAGRLTIIGVELLCLLPITVALAHAWHEPTFLALSELLFGVGSGYGFAAQQSRGTVLKTGFLFLFTIFSITRLLSWSFHASGSRLYLYSVVGLGILGVHCLSALRRRQADRLINRRRSFHLPITKEQIYAWWFLIKVMRNRRTAVSFSFCLLLSVAVSGLLIVRHAIVGTEWFVLGALLATTCAADIRGIVRRYKPAEVNALNGITFFVFSELQAVFVLTLLIGLPLFVTVAIQAQAISLAAQWLLFLSLQLAAGSIGLAASTAGVPANGEVVTQFFTTVAPMLVVSGLLHFGHLQSLNIPEQALIWLTLVVIGVVFCLIVEKGRSKNYGRV